MPIAKVPSCFTFLLSQMSLQQRGRQRGILGECSHGIRISWRMFGRDRVKSESKSPTWFSAIHKIVNEAACGIRLYKRWIMVMPTIVRCAPLFCTWYYYLWRCQRKMNKLIRYIHPLLADANGKNREKNRHSEFGCSLHMRIKSQVGKWAHRPHNPCAAIKATQ